jgi:glucose-1-phosphate thymidylyltransferase
MPAGVRDSGLNPKRKDSVRPRAKHTEGEVIGLVPAAGEGSRLRRLPCSKELYPIGFDKSNFTPKVVSHYLLENMRLAGIKKAFVILRDGKWDIPAYFGDGKMLDMHLGYLLMDAPYGVPYTLDQAYPFVRESRVALGFPDIIFEPNDAFTAVLSQLRKSNADIVLGLFQMENPSKADMVDVDGEGRIRSIQIKPPETHLKYSWGIAAWNPSFTEFMHDYVSAERHCFESGGTYAGRQEMFVGDVIQAAIRNGLAVDTVTFRSGHYHDIGTPEDLLRTARLGQGLREVHDNNDVE